MAEVVILRLVHVLGAVLWVGSFAFAAVFLMPVLSRLGPGAGPVMSGLRERGLLTFMPAVALLTILSGLRLMWIGSGGFASSYFATTWGATYAASGGAAIVAFVLGMVLSRPNAARMAALSAQLGSATDEATKAALSSQLAGVRRNASVLSWAIGGLLFASAGGMAVARYLG